MTDIPFSLPPGQHMPVDAWRYAAELYTADPEPEKDRALVFEQDEKGVTTVLKRSGEPTPDIPAAGPDIPQDAVKNNRVVLVVDGIHTGLAWQRNEMRTLLQGQGPAENHGASVGQPVIGIHQGVGTSLTGDLGRINHDSFYLKGLQAHVMTPAWVARKVYAFDPVVQAIHHEVRQSLEAGRDVQLMAHSGGGTETVLALTLLSQEDNGRWRNAVRDHVRVLSIACGASPDDFSQAGVRADNLYYTGSLQDPVYRLARHPFHPLLWPANLPYVADLVGIASHLSQQEMAWHGPAYVFSQNPGIQAFLDGAPGGVHPIA